MAVARGIPLIQQSWSEPPEFSLRTSLSLLDLKALSLSHVTEKSKFDEIVEQDGVTILIDKKAQLSILGTEMDYVQSKLSAEFVFNNPNITGTCGCGESFSV